MLGPRARRDEFTVGVIGSTRAAFVIALAINEDGKFYVSDFVQKSKIYLLDSGTGMATPVVETHLDNVINIAFKQSPR